MAADVVMPQMGESIFEGTITKWLKKPGDKVERDEPLFEISTDKVDAEIPSPTAGVLKEIKVKEGQTVPINTVVATIDGAGGATAASAPAPTPAPKAEVPKAEAPKPAAAAPAARPGPVPVPTPQSRLRQHHQAHRLQQEKAHEFTARLWFAAWPRSMASISAELPVPVLAAASPKKTSKA